MIVLTKELARKITWIHFLFLTIGMCWLMLFVFYGPNGGLLQANGTTFSEQNLFIGAYLLTILVCIWIPKLYAQTHYRLITLIGVAGTLVCSVCLVFFSGFARWVVTGLLGIFCGLFTFSGIVFILMRQLNFNWQIAVVAYIVGLNPIFSILIEGGVLSDAGVAYWLVCFGSLLAMLVICWFGFYTPAQAVAECGQVHPSGRPHKASLKHTRHMLWLGYAIVFVISLVLFFALFLTQKVLGDGPRMTWFYIGQILAGVSSFALVFFKRSKLPLIYYGFLSVAFAGFILILVLELAPGVKPLAVLFLGFAELGSILEWCLIPRICSLWDKAHVFNRDTPEHNWNLRALRGFVLFYALGILTATLISGWLGQADTPVFIFVISLTALIVLFTGNLILAGFTRYQFFPAVGVLPVEGPVVSEEMRKLKTLSGREQQVLGYIMQGYTMPQVAEKLFISLNTAKTHGNNIYHKLEVSSRQELFLRYLDVQGQEDTRRTPLFDKFL